MVTQPSPAPPERTLRSRAIGVLTLQALVSVSSLLQILVFTPILRAGDFDAYAKYRWIDSKGKKLDIFPESEATGFGKQFTTACRVPVDLPKGAKLEMGVLVGAKTEWLEYEYLDVPAPR